MYTLQATAVLKNVNNNNMSSKLFRALPSVRSKEIIRAALLKHRILFQAIRSAMPNGRSNGIMSCYVAALALPGGTENFAL